jgi:hypothetical protein
MKKILLGTTTLVGAALFASAALAAAPKVTLGGFSEVQAGIMSDDFDANQRNHAFRNNNEISVKVDGKSDMGLGYGAEIWLEADVDSQSLAGSSAAAGSDNLGQGINASKTFLYFEGGWGRVEAGSTLGPDQTLKIDASTIARATGGIGGDWRQFANLGPGTVQFIAMPDLWLNYGGVNSSLGDKTTENISKIVYYTPKWNGFQGGFAYLPDEESRGQGVIRANVQAGQSENIWVAGVNWAGQWDQVSIGLDATGEWGDAELTGTEDLQTWQFGAKLGYMGFSVAASYGDWDESNQLTALNADGSDFWTAGAAYENGPWGVSVGFLDSEFDLGTGNGSNEFQSWSVGADYKLAPGLTPYVEFTWYEQDAPAVVDDNDGHVFLVGSQLNF